MSYFLLIISVLVGALLVIFIKPSKKLVRLLLAFSGSYLLSVTILHLLPEVYTADNNANTIGIFILVGIILQSVLESFSKGAEHGHIHLHSDEKKFPTLLFISLCVHAFSDGLPIHNNDNHNLLWAIVVHKIPIAIVLTSYLIHSVSSKKRIFMYLVVFALMSPLGVLLNNQFELLNTYDTEIKGLIIGIFLHISTIILFESSENHKFNLQKFIAILFGVILTIITL